MVIAAMLLSGKFALTISTTQNGRSLSPKVVISGMDTAESKKIVLLSSTGDDDDTASVDDCDDTSSVDDCINDSATTLITLITRLIAYLLHVPMYICVLHTGNSLVVSFRQSLVLMPGLDNPLQADYMAYMAYTINRKAISSSRDKIDADADIDVDDDINYESMCGISNLIETQLHPSDFTATRIKVTAATQGADSITYKLGKLSVSTNYRVIIVAVCDSQCLQQLSKQHYDPRLLLSCIPSQVGAACKPQSLLYTYLDARTGDTADTSDQNNHEDSHDRRNETTQDIISLSIVIIAVLVVIVFATSMYWMKHNVDTPNCLQLIWGLGGHHHRHYHHPSAAINDDGDDDDDDVFGDSSSSSMAMGRSAWSNPFQSPYLQHHHHQQQQQTDRHTTKSTEMISLSSNSSSSSSSRTSVNRAPADTGSVVGYHPPNPVTSSHARRRGDNNNSNSNSSQSSSSSSQHPQHLSTGVETAKKLLDKWVMDPIRSSSARTMMKKTRDGDDDDDDDAAAIAAADGGTKYTSLPLLDNEELELHL